MFQVSRLLKFFSVSFQVPPICGKNLGKFQGLPCFPIKIVFYSLSICGYFERFVTIQSLGRFDLELWFKALIQGKSLIIGNFNVYVAFPEKLFCICQPNLTQAIQTFVKCQKTIIANSNKRRRFMEAFKAQLIVPQKWFCIRQTNLAFLRLVFRLLGEFRRKLQGTPVWGENFSRLDYFSQKTELYSLTSFAPCTNIQTL